MANAAELAVLFTADPSAVDKALKSVANGMQQTKAASEKGGGLFGGIVKGLGDLGLASIGIGAVKSAVGALAGPIMDTVGAAESMGDAVARAALVFKDYDANAVDIIKDNATIANSLGMTQEAYIANTAAVGNLLKNMGLGADATFDMSIGLTDLAPQLAAFAGIPADKAMDALTKGMTGATKGLKEMGIVIPDIPKGLNDAATAAFIYDEILRQSADAQAAWADNSGDVDVSMQRITAAVGDAKAAIGEALLPIIAPLAEKLADLAETMTTYLQPALDILKATFTGKWAEGGNDALDRMRELAGPLADVILHVGYAMSDVTNAVKALMDGDPEGAWTALGNGVYSAIEAFGDLTGIDITGIIDTLFGGDRDPGDGLWAEMGKWIVETKDKLLVLWDNAKIAWAGIQQAVTDAKPYVVDAMKLIGDAAVILRDAWIDLKDKASEAWDDIQQYVKDAQPKIDEATKAMGESGNWLKSKWQELAAAAPGFWASIGESVRALGPVVDDLMHNVLGPAWDDLKTVWEELKTTAAFTFAFVSAVVAARIKELSDWYHRHADEIKLVFAGAYAVVTGIFKYAWASIIALVRGFLALMRGDTEGARNAFIHAFEGMRDGVKRVLGGLTAIIGGILGGIAKDMGGKAAAIGKSIVDGIWGAILGGKGKVADAGAAIGNAAAAGTKAAVKSFSPSKVFAEIGQWIIDGFVQGIDRNTQRAIEIAGKMASGVAQAARDIIDTFSRLNSTEAKQSTEGLADRFRTLVAAMTPFRAMLAEVGHALTVPLKGSTTSARDIERAAQMFGNVANAIKSVVDVVGTIGGTMKTGPGGQIIEIVQNILPSKEQVDGLVDRARDFLLGARRIVEAVGHPDQYMDMTLLADIVKAMADSLKAVADVDLTKTVEVTSLQMAKAMGMMSRMVSLFDDPGGLFDLFTRLGEDTRKNVAASAGSFASMIGGLADALKVAGSFTEKLDFATVDIAKVGVAALRNITLIVGLFDDKGGIFDAFVRLGDKVRTEVVDAAKAFADLLGSLVDILSLSEVGKINPTLEISATALRDVLYTLRNLDKAVLTPMREQLKRTTEQLEAASRDFKAMGDWFGSIVAVVKVSAVGMIAPSIEVSASAMRDVLLALRNLEKAVISDIREQLKLTTEQLEAATKDFKAMAEWFGAIAAVVRITAVGQIVSGIDVSASAMEDVLRVLRVLERFVISKIRESLGMTLDELEAASKDFKALADWFGSIASVLKSTEIGTIVPSLNVSATALQTVLLTIQNLNKSVLEPMRQQLMGMGDLEGMAKDFKLLADFIGSIASILRATAELPEAKAIPQLTAEIVDRMLEPIRLLGPAIAGLAPTIDKAANDALASMGPALESLNKVFGVVETAIASPFFGSGRRARSSSSMDVFKRRLTESIKQAVTVLVDAMNQVNIPADLATKFAPLQLAADAIKSAFDVLAGISLPKDIDAIIRAAGALAGFGGGGGQGGGQTGASGGASGDGGGLGAAIMRAIGAELDGWKGDQTCAAPIMRAIGADLQGWKGDQTCAPPIFKAIGEQLQAWLQRGSTGTDMAPPIFKAIGEQIKAWLQRGSTGTDIADPIMEAVGEQIKAWLQRGSTGPGTTGGGAGIFGDTGNPFSAGVMNLAAQSVTLAGPVNVGFTGTFQVASGRSLAVELVEATITDTPSLDKLIRAMDQRKAQKGP